MVNAHHVGVTIVLMLLYRPHRRHHRAGRGARWRDRQGSLSRSSKTSTGMSPLRRANSTWPAILCMWY